MTDQAELKMAICAAFASVEYPGDGCLRGSSLGKEPYLLEQEFKGLTDWSRLDATFLDNAPGGYGSALSFFSQEAFRFYLPAYLIADIDRKLVKVDPVMTLCVGFDDRPNLKIISRRYGGGTAFEAKRHRFSMLARDQATAVTGYLEFRRDMADCDFDLIEQALANYWKERVGGV